MAHLESLVIFDSNVRTREALVFGFERDGYKVYATDRAEDALAMARTRVPQLFVAAVPDSEADEGAGEAETLNLIGHLREEPATRELPIVVLGERGAREGALRAGADEFVSRPAFIRDVLTLSTLAVAMRQDGDESGVAGMLQDYELYFLTRALSVAQRSGVLELERGDRAGEVHFVKGEVVTARCGRMNGLAAFHHLLLWGEASIHLRLATPTGERKIHVPMDDLLAGGARFAREFEAVAGRVGGTQAIYRQEPRRAAEARAQIPSEVMAAIKHYDGRRPLIDVVEDSPFKALDTIKITWRLAELGAIEKVEGVSAATGLTAQLAVRDWLLGTNRPPEDGKSTVTEAGRRAAELIAEAEARRRAENAPQAEILDDTDKFRTLAAPAAAPRSPAPGVTRPTDTGRYRKGKKRKGRPGDSGPTVVATKEPAAKNRATDTVRTPKMELQPSQPDAPAPTVDLDATIPFSRMPLESRELEPEAPPVLKAPEPARPAAPAPAAPAPTAPAPAVPAPAVPAPTAPAPAAAPAFPPAPPAFPAAPAAPAFPPAPPASGLASTPSVPPTVNAHPAAGQHADPPKPAPAPPAATKPAPAATKPAPAATKPAPAKAAPVTKPASKPHKPEPHKPQALAQGGQKQLTSTANGKTAPLPRETFAFTKVEEDFFAREKDLHAEPAVDTFDDLEPVESSPKRRWFHFGNKKLTQSVAKGPPKKR